MTLNFDEIIATARQSYEAQREPAVERRRAELQEHRRTTQMGIDHLGSHVVPLLRQAQLAFAKQGIHLQLRNIFDVSRFPQPRMPSIEVLLKPQESLGATGKFAESRAVSFFADGQKLRLEIGYDVLDSTPQEPIEMDGADAEPIVERGVKALAASYYRAAGRQE